MRKIVLTGGPGIGKTTLIEILAAKGYAIVPEASRIVVEDEEARGGDARPWQNVGKFQRLVSEKQVALEAEARAGKDGLCFLDRGLIDGYAYADLTNVPIPAVIDQEGRGRYDLVFLLDPLPEYQKDAVRFENEEERRKIHDLIGTAYEKFGYRIIRVPVLPPEKRARFILDFIGKTA